MTNEKLIEYLRDPAKLDQHSLAKLDKWRHDFPFSQTLQLLYLLNLYKEDDPAFGKQLRSLAATVADRSRLREWIEYIDRDNHQARKPQQEADPEWRVYRSQELEELEARILEEMNEMEEKRAAIRDLIRKKEQIISAGDNSEEGKPKEQSGTLPKDQLLEEFLKKQEKQRPSFFNPVETARRSITDQTDVVSETLARLYAKQGNIKKAMEIYKVLSLKFPEKSSYFAAQIERLKKKQ